MYNHDDIGLYTYFDLKCINTLRDLRGMNMNLKGTKTEQNLMKALAGESIARNKYSYFADQARKEGNEEVAQFFDRLSKNEKEHARLWYKLLKGEVGDTLENLKVAAQGEHDEWTDMYVQFANDAKEEGFGEIAKLFNEVRRIERNHERENLKWLNILTNKAEEAKEKASSAWMCGHCGFTSEEGIEGNECPLCKHEIIRF